ncbi:MAG: hypothetical protein HN921_03450 [Bacteroidetes bacterium]|jgi:hypothetical protein|nr:hypothetical protein [Bacteroidota bacterium]MBT3934741.1 hypothetical protein [Bacteroidota bacterium]MBT5531088.1 hypothetical protein [Cytophagia bacterium]MBT7038877.1 hypothetical protein [Bacteroidota bacterium]
MSDLTRKEGFYHDFKIFIEAVNDELIIQNKISMSWFSTVGRIVGINLLSSIAPSLFLGEKITSSGYILSKIKKEKNKPFTASLEVKIMFAKKEFIEMQMLMEEDPKFAKSEIDKLFNMLIQSI